MKSLHAFMDLLPLWPTRAKGLNKLSTGAHWKSPFLLRDIDTEYVISILFLYYPHSIPITCENPLPGFVYFAFFAGSTFSKSCCSLFIRLPMNHFGLLLHKTVDKWWKLLVLIFLLNIQLRTVILLLRHIGFYAMENE